MPPTFSPTMTRKQEAIHRFMVRFQREHGMPATIRILGSEFGIKSTNGIVSHLKSMTRKGFVVTIGDGSTTASKYIAVDPNKPYACVYCGCTCRGGKAAHAEGSS